MSTRYMVKAFIPTVAGCGATDQGWDETRCKEFEDFLNHRAAEGWRFHSSEFRQVAVKGCGGKTGAWLVCTFERTE